MKLIYQKYCIKAMQMIRTLFCNNLRHNLYPKKLSDRQFDFNKIYENDYGKLKRVNLGAGPYFARDGWISADYLPYFEKNNKNLVHLNLSKGPNKLPFNNLGIYHLGAYFEELLIEKLKEAGSSNVYGSAFTQSRYTAMREASIFDGTHPWLSQYV